MAETTGSAICLSAYRRLSIREAHWLSILTDREVRQSALLDNVFLGGKLGSQEVVNNGREVVNASITPVVPDSRF